MGLSSCTKKSGVTYRALKSECRFYKGTTSIYSYDVVKDIKPILNNVTTSKGREFVIGQQITNNLLAHLSNFLIRPTLACGKCDSALLFCLLEALDNSQTYLRKLALIFSFP